MIFVIFSLDFFRCHPLAGIGESNGNGNVAFGGHVGNAVYAAPCFSKSTSTGDSNLY